MVQGLVSAPLSFLKRYELTTPKPMPLHLTPLDNNFAFEVQGLDIWSGLDDAHVRTLDDAWANQGVLVFHRQSLSEEELDEYG